MFDPIAVVSGVIQTCLNFYFIYVYFKKYPHESDIESPPEAASEPPATAIDYPSRDTLKAPTSHETVPPSPLSEASAEESGVQSPPAVALQPPTAVVDVSFSEVPNTQISHEATPCPSPSETPVGNKTVDKI